MRITVALHNCVWKLHAKNVSLWGLEMIKAVARISSWISPFHSFSDGVPQAGGTLNVQQSLADIGLLGVESLVFLSKSKACASAKKESSSWKFSTFSVYWAFFCLKSTMFIKQSVESEVNLGENSELPGPLCKEDFQRGDPAEY